MRMTDGREPERGTDDKEEKRWLLRYGATIVVLAALWWTAYSCIQGAAAWVVYDALALRASRTSARRWSSSFTTR